MTEIIGTLVTCCGRPYDTGVHQRCQQCEKPLQDAPGPVMETVGSKSVIAHALEQLQADNALIKRSGLSWRFLGDPVLQRPTRDVTGKDMPFVCGILLPTMRKLHDRAWTPGVGISANQVGSDLRVSIAKLGTTPPGHRGPPRLGRWVEMINPKLTEHPNRGVNLTQEGCLSIPNFRTSTVRYPWIVVAWKDPAGQHQQQKLAGFDAQILQHELDHLDGKTICDGLPRQQRRAAERAVAKYTELAR